MKNQMTRREFLEMGAKGALSLMAITACGDLFSTKAHGVVAVDEIKVGPDNRLLKVDELMSLKAANFEFKGKKAIVLYNDGEIRAFENICTHKGGPTKVSDGKLVCQWHGAMFDPLTGESLKRPAPQGSKLPEIKLTVKDGEIFIA